ncbi:hypothetical protein Tco_0629008 [Tanacetum coccineum]|uniref:Uncharacterized protein n=1 Tax=Tanacetum coccineum TaxID=301880 RepID=A0ABQ4WRY8_9ASTR
MNRAYAGDFCTIVAAYIAARGSCGSRSYEAPLPESNTSGSAEDSMKLKELMNIVPKLVTNKKLLETELATDKDTYGKGSFTLRIREVNSGLIDDHPLDFFGFRESLKDEVAQIGVSKVKSTDKGKRYRRRARSMAKIINTGLDAEKEINTGIEEVSTGSAKVNSGTASKRGQREGNTLMVEKDIQATHKTKEQIRQEAAGLEEAY